MKPASIHAAYRRLAMSPIPIRVRPPESPPVTPRATPLVANVCRGHDAAAEMRELISLHHAASRPSTDLATLRAVKAYAKRHYQLGPADTDPSDRRVYLAVYLTTIAAGLRWHRTNLSNNPLTSLAFALRWVSAQRWVPASTRRLCAPGRLLNHLSRPDARATTDFDYELKRTP